MSLRAKLEYHAAQIRKLTITAIESAGYGHIGGSMSICDALAVLYCDIMKIDPLYPDKPDRDRLVMSKGHCGPALYATLAYKSIFPKVSLRSSTATALPCPAIATALKPKALT